MNSSAFRSALTAAFDSALDYVDHLDTTPIGPTADLATLRARLLRPLNDASLPPEQVIAELTAAVEGGIMGSAGPRFFGWVIGGSLPSALAADWLTSAWDQNSGLYATSPAAAIVEEAAGAWLKDIFGIPAGASFAFVTGCQMAHTTCLAAARHALLACAGWDVEAQGLFGAPPIHILSSGAAHGTIDRTLRLLGIGKNQFIPLADDRGLLQADALEQALAENPGAPTIVLLQAGEINTGGFEEFTALIPIAHAAHAWVHIDGAFGLWAAACPKLRHLMAGAELADSWATDGHKWLNVPYDCGYAFLRDAASHRASMSHHAAYLTHDDAARDELDWNPEFSRRARGFPTYAALRQLGRRGIATLIEDGCRLAHALVTGLAALSGVELLCEPTLNQGLVRFLDPNFAASDTSAAAQQAHDLRTDQMITAINATGEAFFTGSTWHSNRVMRVSVVNWQTTDEDISRVLRAVEKVLTS